MLDRAGSRSYFCLWLIVFRLYKKSHFAEGPFVLPRLFVCFLNPRPPPWADIEANNAQA